MIPLSHPILSVYYPRRGGGMSFIQQNLLPGYRTKQIQISKYSRRHAGEAVRLLLRLADLHDARYLSVGIAIQQSPTGSVEAVVLATTLTAFVIFFDERGVFPMDKPFEDLFRNSCQDFDLHLVGFGMAHMAVHVHSATSFYVQGVDLSTFFSPDARQSWNPAKVVSHKNSLKVEQGKINGLWNGEDGIDQVCLRAWLSAWCVVSFLSRFICEDKDVALALGPVLK
jgi:hypothetical protein